MPEMTKYLYQGTRDGLVDALANLITEKMLDGAWDNSRSIIRDVEQFLRRNEEPSIPSSYDTKSALKVKMDVEQLPSGEAIYRVPTDKHPPYQI